MWYLPQAGTQIFFVMSQEMLTIDRPMNFLNNRITFDSRDKLSPVYNMVSSGLKKMLILTILYTHKGVSENVCPVICMDTIFLIILMAVFISHYCIDKGMPRQMLFPTAVVVNVKALRIL